MKNCRLYGVQFSSGHCHQGDWDFSCMEVIFLTFLSKDHGIDTVKISFPCISSWKHRSSNLHLNLCWGDNWGYWLLDPAHERQFSVEPIYTCSEVVKGLTMLSYYLSSVHTNIQLLNTKWTTSLLRWLIWTINFLHGILNKALGPCSGYFICSSGNGLPLPFSQKVLSGNYPCAKDISSPRRINGPQTVCRTWQKEKYVAFMSQYFIYF